MTDARIENVHEDKVRAREFLSQAELLLKDANAAPLSAEGQAILLHTATVSACDAILQAVGLRVTPGDRAHVIRLEAALAELPGDTEELFESLDAARERRNEASYLAGFVAQASVADAREATTELIETTQRFLAG